MADPKPARDLQLLDSIDRFARFPYRGEVWRVCGAGRDPLLGAASNGRWCDGTFNVLYTSAERDGAIAEVHAYLDLQPVFPSKFEAHVHRIAVEASGLLHLSDDVALAKLGVDVERYRDRTYARTQEVADAACFLGFDGLIASSARWPCRNIVLFTERIAPDRVTLVESEPAAVEWADWRRRARR